MEFTNEKLGLRFTVPDSLTAVDLLKYDGARQWLVGTDTASFIILWNMAKTIIREWECDILPDPSIDLDTLTDKEKVPAQVQIIKYTGITVSQWRRSLDEVPKNS